MHCTVHGVTFDACPFCEAAEAEPSIDLTVEEDAPPDTPRAPVETTEAAPRWVELVDASGEGRVEPYWHGEPAHAIPLDE